MRWHALLGGHHGMKYFFFSVNRAPCPFVPPIRQDSNWKAHTFGIVEHYCFIGGKTLFPLYRNKDRPLNLGGVLVLNYLELLPTGPNTISGKRNGHSVWRCALFCCFLSLTSFRKKTQVGKTKTFQVGPMKIRPFKVGPSTSACGPKLPASSCIRVIFTYPSLDQLFFIFFFFFLVGGEYKPLMHLGYPLRHTLWTACTCGHSLDWAGPLVLASGWEIASHGDMWKNTRTGNWYARSYCWLQWPTLDFHLGQGFGLSGFGSMFAWLITGLLVLHNWRELWVYRNLFIGLN